MFSNYYCYLETKEHVLSFYVPTFYGIDQLAPFASGQDHFMRCRAGVGFVPGVDKSKARSQNIRVGVKNSGFTPTCSRINRRLETVPCPLFFRQRERERERHGLSGLRFPLPRWRRARGWASPPPCATTKNARFAFFKEKEIECDFATKRRSSLQASSTNVRGTSSKEWRGVLAKQSVEFRS